ncbi:MAG: sigma-70 family RNA polymerase sigma factor [Phycisphaerales bacterium]|nr:MAG: sigma-70 family RNA polymerase sigma factor [Phycisphaerales bacterium]
MLEDKLLVIKCRRGDKEAMCRLYEKYKDYLLTLARGLVDEQAEAEDLVHDAFVAFARRARQFELTGSLKGYLATSVVNGARDRMRAAARWAKAPAPGNPLATRPNDPEQCAAEAEDITRLRQALRQIPYEQREAVLLHIRGGMKFRQMAKVQGVSVSTIHARYRYGLDKLRSLLNSEVEK